MAFSRLKILAFSLGFLTVCLAASAQTPGLEHIGCCGGAGWPDAAGAAPPIPAAPRAPLGYIQRDRTRHDWRITLAGLKSPRLGLPPVADQALQKALGPPPTQGVTNGDDASSQESVTTWIFPPPFYGDGYEGPVRFGRRKCKDHKGWCHGKPAPPPISAVPEPDTWALFVISAAGLGGVLRLRRRLANLRGAAAR